MSLQVIMNVHVACTLMCTLQIMLTITSPTLTFPFGVCVCADDVYIVNATERSKLQD